MIIDYNDLQHIDLNELMRLKRYIEAEMTSRIEKSIIGNPEKLLKNVMKK